MFVAREVRSGFVVFSYIASRAGRRSVTEPASWNSESEAILVDDHLPGRAGRLVEEVEVGGREPT
jgi:hypothetical protein